MREVNRKWFRIVLVSIFLLLAIATTAFADLKTVNLDIEKVLQMNADKIIYNENGSKFAILLKENIATKKKKYGIYLYDFIQGTWTRGPELSSGYPGDLEPLVFNKDGSRLAFRLGEDLLVLDTMTNKITHQLKGVGSSTQAAFSPDDRYVAFLMMAEWEVPTSLFLFDLTAEEENAQLIPGVIYEGEFSAAGPLSWTNDSTGIYFIEEFTWGTINSKGILKKYDLISNRVSEVYNIKAPTTRVSQYFFSPNGEYRALVMRDLDENLVNSRYGLLIQKDGQFVYGAQFQNWRDSIETEVTDYLSTAGWVGNGFFYWINHNETGSTLYLYSIEDDELAEKSYSEQIHLTPAGILLKMVKE